MTDDATTPDVAQLTARIRQLEGENARLKGAPRPQRAQRWRPVVSAICLVLVAVLVPASIVAGWARAQLVDEERFVAAVAPLAHDPAVQQMIIDETMAAIDARVDFSTVTGRVIEGINSLGLPPVAADALLLLQKPAADGLRNLVQEGVATVVRSDAFANVWATAVRGAHRAVTTTATSEGGGVVAMTPEGLALQLGPIVDDVKQRLADRGVGAASFIPSVDRQIIIGDGQAVSTVRVAYAGAVAAGWWVPVLALALLATGILVARRRSVAVVGGGIALFAGGLVTSLALSAGTVAVGVAADRTGLSPQALDVMYTTLVDDMVHTAVVTTLLGAVLALFGWVLGNSRPAVRFRALVGGLNHSARVALRGRGLDTGAFGDALSRARTAVRAGIVVLAAVWLVLMRPLSFGDVALVVVTSVAVAWLAELLQRRADEAPAAGVAPEDEAPGVLLARDGEVGV